MMNDPTNARWTKGPWCLEAFDENTGFEEVNTVERGRDVPTKGYQVAIVSAAVAGSANARLIAAAPELADLMLRVLPERQTAKWTETEVADWYEAARVALRKAGAL